MMRMVSKITSFFEGSLEGCLQASKIKEFVLNKYARLNNEQQKVWGIDRELIELKTNLANLGWIALNEPLLTVKENYQEENGSKVYQWINDLKNGRIIDRGIIAKGAGANLDWLDDNNEDLNGFKAIALESILKIVEVKRKKIINAFSWELTVDERYQEGLMISILLSRTSRRHDDLRYLNAALKMNDWYYLIFRSRSLEKSLIYYLLALTEQEISAAELL